MDMFTSYRNVPQNYIPNNITDNSPIYSVYNKLESKEASKPFESYNAKGELEGYFWYYGDELDLEFVIDGEVVIADDSLILRVAGKVPGEYADHLHQKAYNIVDRISWTCTSIVDNKATWEQDDEFAPLPDSGRCIYLDMTDYLKDKTARICIYNFRYELLKTIEAHAQTNIMLHIDKELSETLLRGIYYCSLEVFNEDMHETLFNESDCKLIVR